jgi:ankyrin repeat protein
MGKRMSFIIGIVFTAIIGAIPINAQAAEALLAACKSGDLALAKDALAKGAEVNSLSADAVSPLIYAVESGSVQLVRYLLDHGADVKFNDDSKEWTALMLACQGDDPGYGYATAARNREYEAKRRQPNAEIVRNLIEKGAKVNAEKEGGYSPLMLAAQRGSLPIVRYLLQKSANTDSIAKGPSGFALAYVMNFAAQSGNIDLVKFLVSKGLSVNETNDSGDSPILEAARSGNLSLVKYLISKGASIRATQSDGTTLLHLGAFSGNVNLVKFLVAQGLDVNATNNQKESPLVNAALSGDFETVKFLVEKGGGFAKQGTNASIALKAINNYVSNSALPDLKPVIDYLDKAGPQ